MAPKWGIAGKLRPTPSDPDVGLLLVVQKLSGEPKPTSDHRAAPTFAPVRMAVEPPAPVIESVFRDGERLLIRAEASADLLQAAMMALRSRC